LPAMTVRGAGVTVMCVSDLTAYFALTTINTWLRVRLVVKRGTTEVWARDYMFNVPAVQYLAAPSLTAVDYNVPAGSHVYTLVASVPTGPASITVDGSVPGWFMGYELC
jgi:hypothetical protein